MKIIKVDVVPDNPDIADNLCLEAEINKPVYALYGSDLMQVTD